MKSVLSNNIAGTVRQPYTKVTHEWYNDMVLIPSFALSAYSTGDLTRPTVLYGCVNSDSPNADIDYGYIFFQNEIFYCPAFVDATISDDIVGTITTSYDAADPVLFSDGNSYNVHQNRTIVWSDAVSGSGDLDYADLVFKNTDVDWDYTTFYTAANDYVYYRRDFSQRRIFVQGVLNQAASITLPTGYRPAATVTFTSGLCVTNGGGPSFGYSTITITSGGAISGTNLGITAGAYDSASFSFDFAMPD